MKRFSLIFCIVTIFGLGYWAGTSQTSVVQPAIAQDDITDDVEEVETPAEGAKYIRGCFLSIKHHVGRELNNIHAKIHEHSPAAINTALGARAASLVTEYNTMKTWYNNHTADETKHIPNLLTPPPVVDEGE